jgi:hypothetical protein
MLPPNIRQQVIDVLVQNESNFLRQNTYDGTIETLMRNGFKGYAAFTDEQLVATLKAKSSQNNSWDCTAMLNQLADFIILGQL